MKHHCHALNCTNEVAPKLLMCRRHWAMVDKKIQAQVYGSYHCGQESSKRPTKEFLQAARAAITDVAKKEGDRK